VTPAAMMPTFKGQGHIIEFSFLVIVKFLGSGCGDGDCGGTDVGAGA